MKKFLKIFFLAIGIPIVILIAYFLLIKSLDSKAIDKKSFLSYNIKTPVLLPSKFLKGERFYFKMPTDKNDTLLAFGDTGGGMSMIFPWTADKPSIQSKIKRGLLSGVMPVRYVLFRDLIPDENIPPTIQVRGLIVRWLFSRVPGSLLVVPPMDNELKLVSKVFDGDIFLGQNFFMGKSWTFDYPNQQIWVNTPLQTSDLGKPGAQRIGFKKSEANESMFGHGSMFIEVDGEIIEVLFDTGATIILSDGAKKALNTTDKTIAGSFIAASVFDKWKTKHPEWKVYEKADMDRDMIEVPAVKIGGYEVGPVLFSRRPDEAWSEGMIGTMDTVVKGAIGGSALKYFKVTVDYNSDLIKFER